MQRTILGLLALLTLSSGAVAQDIAVNTGEVRIPRGQSKAFEFGTVPQRDTTILLDVVARLDSDDFGGSMTFMKLVLNGRVVQAAKTRTAGRLINRNLVSPVLPRTPSRWFNDQSWRVLYAPDFEGALKIAFYEGNPYQTVLDVTDLINPAAENRLQVSNTCPYAPPAGSKGNFDLVVKDIIVRVKPGASPLMASSVEDQDLINRGTPGAGPARYQGKLLPGGGFRLQVGDQALTFTSRLSYPNAGLNTLAPTASPVPTGQRGFTVRTKPTATGGEVTATGPDYRVVRRVKFTARKVEVSDQITNLHSNVKLGLLVENTVDLKGTNARVRLAGNPDPAINHYYSPGNPSVYATLGKLGLGLLCEDDVYRNQATLFFDPEQETAGLRTDKLCLQPGGSYTLQWSVYPVGSPDYHDFINLVRQDWGSNYTVEGAWTFFYNPDTILATPVATLAEQYKRLGIKRVCYCGGWVDAQADPKRIGFGTGVLDDYWADFRTRLRQAAERIRQAAPDCKVYLYYDSRRDTAEGGHERYRDSWVTDPEGNQLSTGWSGAFSLTYDVVATLDNSYGKAMLAAVDRYMNELRADGLYWDEMEALAYGEPLITYNVPDGYSCELDPKTYAFQREIGIHTIMGEGHRVAVIKRVRELGGDLMGNGPTATKDILALKPQRMLEIDHNDYWSYEGNLQSPLGYAGHRSVGFDIWLRGLKLATLLVGTTSVYTHDFSAYVFPFTPIELHSGYLLGKERIIASHSGNYGWPGERALVQVRYFGKDGKLTPRDFPTRVGAEARTAVDVGTDEAVVLERVPLSFRPGAGTGASAEVSQLRYGAEGVSLHVRAPRGGALSLSDGAFPLRDGAVLKVGLGGKSHSLKVARRALLVPLPVGFVGTVNIAP